MSSSSPQDFSTNVSLENNQGEVVDRNNGFNLNVNSKAKTSSQFTIPNYVHEKKSTRENRTNIKTVN